MNKWSEVAIHTTHDAQEPVANILHEAGVSGVVIEDARDLEGDEWQVKHGQSYQLEPGPDDYPEVGIILKGYLPLNDQLEATVENIKRRVNTLQLYDIHTGPWRLTQSEVHEEDWAHAWKKYYKPVQITDRLTISPTWEVYEPQSEREQVIELDPGMAFGTGSHPTTVLSIQALEQYINADDHVLDVGCGSGVLSIASVKLGAKSVLAVDIDEVSVRVAKENIHLNGQAEQIDVRQNDLLHHIEAEADIVVGNILAEVILRFVHDAFRVLRAGGTFITSGIIARKETEVREALQAEGFILKDRKDLQGWVALVAEKPCLNHLQ